MINTEEKVENTKELNNYYQPGKIKNYRKGEYIYRLHERMIDNDYYGCDLSFYKIKNDFEGMDVCKKYADYLGWEEKSFGNKEFIYKLNNDTGEVTKTRDTSYNKIYGYGNKNSVGDSFTTIVHSENFIKWAIENDLMEIVELKYI